MTTSATEIARLATITASERAAERNAETRAWAEAKRAEGVQVGFGLLVEEQAHWGENATGLDLERELLIGGFSDEFKAFHGIRPRWISFEGLSFAECESVVEANLPSDEEWAAKAERRARTCPSTRGSPATPRAWSPARRSGCPTAPPCRPRPSTCPASGSSTRRDPSGRPTRTPTSTRPTCPA